jgi:pilus assembly protein CpaE
MAAVGKGSKTIAPLVELAGRLLAATGDDPVPLNGGTARGGSLIARIAELMAKKPARK